MESSASQQEEEQQQKTEHIIPVSIDGHVLFTVNADGKLRRVLGTETVDADPDDASGTGVRSRDVTVDEHSGVSVRIFRPDSLSKLPLVFYFHGGAFCVCSPATAFYHRYLCRLAADGKLLVVAAAFRLAPENRLPAAFDDCVAVLRWALAGAGRADAWLAQAADLRRVFLAGDSSGGTIVHAVALRARHVAWPDDVAFRGGLVFHPFFHRREDTSELTRQRFEFMRQVCLPAGEDGDYPEFNPVGPRSPDLSEMVFRRVFVAVAGKDKLREGGLEYHRQLTDAGFDAELDYAEDEEHDFHMLDLDRPASVQLMKKVVRFVFSEGEG